MLKCPCKNVFRLETNKNFIFEKYHRDIVHLYAIKVFISFLRCLKLHGSRTDEADHKQLFGNIQIILKSMHSL